MRSMRSIASSPTDESLSETGHYESSTFSHEDDGGTVSRDEGCGSSRSPKEDDLIEPATAVSWSAHPSYLQQKHFLARLHAMILTSPPHLTHLKL